MTGATLLASTDNVVQQYGEECLGTCGQFWLRLVQDDPEKDSSIQPRRVLRTRISRGSTYVYVQGCPSERGCTIVLRGATRHVLAQVKHILNFAMVVAYHLRLEVAYYFDRCADLPVTSDVTDYDDSSDVDDEILDESTVNAPKLQDPTSVLHEFLSGIPLAKKRSERQLLSTSLDVDFNVPYSRELIGTQLFRTKHLAKFQVESHQTLLINSLLIGEGTSFPQQKSPSDLKGIKYYTKHDIAFGQFIIDNCFQLSRGGNREPRMLDQTLTFVHRPGRVDITVKKADRPVSTHDEAYYLTRDPNHAPLYISSYCKECGKVVMPPKLLSDETWKMSFGKFLEMSFYNRSARCYHGGCSHNLRDCHVLSLLCESYVAIFEFVPIHAYTLHVRDGMSFPEDLYYSQTVSLLAQLPIKHLTLMEDFRLAMHVLEKEIKEILAGRPEDLALAMGDVQMMEAELSSLAVSFLEDVLKTYECLPRKYADEENENRVRMLLTEKLAKNPNAVSDSTSDAMAEGSAGFNSPLGLEDDVDFKREQRETIMSRTSVAEDLLAEMPERELVQDVDPIVATHFPAALMRNTYLRALRWNTRIDTIYRFLESVRKMILEQQQQLPTNSLALVAPATILSSIASASLGEDAIDAEPSKVGDLSPGSDGAKRDEPVVNAVRSPVDTLSPSILAKDSDFAHAHLLSTESISLNALAQPAGMNSLYRAAIEQNRRTAEKPVDKMTRITKALSRFLVGNKDSSSDDQQKFFVPLGDFGSARLGLKPGRNGEVVSVTEDVLPSVIAYSLTTNEYYDGLQASLHANNVDQTDFEGGHDDASEKQPVAGSEKRDGNAADRSVSSGADSGRALSLPFKKKKPVSQAIKQDANNLSPIPEENMEEHDLDNEDGEQGTLPKTTSYGMMKNLMDGFSNTEDNANPSNSDVSAFGGMFEYSKSNDDNAEQAAGLPTSPRSPRPPTAPNTPSNLDKGNSAFPDATTPNVPLTMDPINDGGTPPRANPKEGGFDDMSPNERQMISQDKSNIRVRFDDYDDEGNMLCKFQCQIFWAKQFEAVRNCYFKEEENRENFVRSLAMTNRWVAQGGKSGASFAKTLDERLVIKVISRVELQMFLDFAPAYFGNTHFYMLATYLS
ncbi:hypothetical protein EON65_02425 [archaeon]|nr:MAG: hypothetical protein EON65_02425 [archaeon]